MPAPKKMIPLCILEILKRHTDENHTLDQRDIIDLLRVEYDLEVERKAIRRNIEELIDMNYPIRYNEIESECNTIWADFWLERDLSEAELRLLIDGLLFSNHIPHRQRQQMVKKIEGLASEHFKSYVRHIATLPDAGDSNKEIFFTISILDEAIEKKRKVSFKYLDMGTDKKLHARPDENGKPKIYTVSPYQMAAKEGKYYLICNYDKYDNISNYRIDRISQIQLLEDEKIRPFKELRNANGQDLNLGEYMKEHIYMYSGGETHVRFRIVKRMVSDIVDIFGKDVRFEDETDEYVTVSVNVNEQAMILFAQSYSPDVVILEPQRMVDQMKDWIKKVKEKYQ